MRTLRLSLSLLSYMDDLEFLAAALAANPETADLAPGVEKSIADCEVVFGKERAARREVTRADAVVAIRDSALDTTTQRLAGLVFIEANQDRKSTFYRRIFPTAPSEFVRQGLRRQAQLTIDVMVPELRKLPDSSSLKPFAAQLETHCKGAVEAIDARGKAMGARGMVAVDVEDWKSGVNKMRTQVYAELFTRAVGKGYPRTWADAFFRPASDTDRAANEEPTPPAPEPSPNPEP
jgi:hypothetical protein